MTTNFGDYTVTIGLNASNKLEVTLSTGVKIIAGLTGDLQMFSKDNKAELYIADDGSCGMKSNAATQVMQFINTEDGTEINLGDGDITLRPSSETGKVVRIIGNLEVSGEVSAESFN